MGLATLSAARRTRLGVAGAHEMSMHFSTKPFAAWRGGQRERLYYAAAENKMRLDEASDAKIPRRRDARRDETGRKATRRRTATATAETKI